MSGSAKLNHTMKEAAEYWHPLAIANTDCGPLLPAPHTTDKQALFECLHNLSAGELVDALPAMFDPPGLWGSFPCNAVQCNAARPVPATLTSRQRGCRSGIVWRLCVRAIAGRGRRLASARLPHLFQFVCE